MPPRFVVKVVYYIVDNVFIFTPLFSKYISRYFIPGSSPGGGTLNINRLSVDINNLKSAYCNKDLYLKSVNERHDV